MRIRIVGTEDECRTVAGRLADIVDVQEISGPRTRRGDSRLVQMHADVSVGTDPGRMVAWSTPEDQAAAIAAVLRLSAEDRAVVLAHLTGYAPSIVLTAIESTGKDACACPPASTADRAALRAELQHLRQGREAWEATARACTCQRGQCSRETSATTRESPVAAWSALTWIRASPAMRMCSTPWPCERARSERG